MSIFEGRTGDLQPRGKRLSQDRQLIQPISRVLFLSAQGAVTQVDSVGFERRFGRPGAAGAAL